MPANATAFNMTLGPDAHCSLALRVPQFAAAHDDVQDRVNDGLRLQAQQVIDRMMTDPAKIIPAVHSTSEKCMSQKAKKNSAGEPMITASTVGTLPADVLGWDVIHTAFVPRFGRSGAPT